MIDRNFWEDAKRAWAVVPPPKITGIKGGSGGTIDPSLLSDPWDIDGEQPGAQGFEEPGNSGGGEGKPSGSGQVPDRPKRPSLDRDQYDVLMAKKDMPGYIDACHLLLACQLPEHMEYVYGNLIEQMEILEDSVDKFKDVYHADMDQFYEYYIPEALQLTETYLEYIEIGIDDDIVHETETEVMQALEKLLLAVNEKKDEVYKFASIEVKAKAKALESLMSQDGFVDSAYKIKKGGGDNV